MLENPWYGVGRAPVLERQYPEVVSGVDVVENSPVLEADEGTHGRMIQQVLPERLRRCSVENPPREDLRDISVIGGQVEDSLEKQRR